MTIFVGNPTVMMTSSSENIFCVTGHLCGKFTGQRPMMRSFEVFYLRLSKRLSKQSWGWCFETLSCSLWRHCNGTGGLPTRRDSNSESVSIPWGREVVNRINVVLSYSSRAKRDSLNSFQNIWITMYHALSMFMCFCAGRWCQYGAGLLIDIAMWLPQSQIFISTMRIMIAHNNIHHCYCNIFVIVFARVTVITFTIVIIFGKDG